MDIKKYFTVRNVVTMITIVAGIFLLAKFYKYEKIHLAQYRKSEAEYFENQRKNEELINAAINDDVVKVNELLKNVKVVIFNVKKRNDQDSDKSKKTEEKTASKEEMIQSLLVLAARNGSDKVFYSLHKQYPIKKDLASHLIIYAALLGNNDMINTLFKDGADLNANATSKMSGQTFKLTPMSAAVESGNIGTVKLLLNHGAKITNDDLDQATRDMRENITDLLIKRGADVNHMTSTYDGSYLSILLENGLTNIAKKYLNKFNDIDDSDSNSIFSMRPIQYAAEYGDLDLIKMLQKRGAAQGSANGTEWKDNFLNSALMSNNKQVIDYALAQGFKLNWKDDRNYTPVFVAAKYCSPQLFNYLLAKGADVSVTDKEGETPASSAIQGDNNEVLKIIINKLNIYQNKTLSEDLLAQAVRWNNMEAFKMFFDKGYAVNDKALQYLASRYKNGKYDDSIAPEIDRSEMRKMINAKYPNLIHNYEKKNSKDKSIFDSIAMFKDTTYNLPEQNEQLAKHSPGLLQSLNHIEKKIQRAWQTDELTQSQSGLIYIVTHFEKGGFIEYTTDPYYIHNLRLKPNVKLRKFYCSANRATETSFGNIDEIVMHGIVHVNLIHALIYFKYDAKTKTKQVKIVKVQLNER